ncbi:hypothetical protein [Kitasatospora sp. NPDC093806]|uniref:RICIN domain-containing protein n=1 Tax=Kitasatospora sp. NPDC093806 TaxID=3155075 RepID=UPI003424267D
MPALFKRLVTVLALVLLGTALVPAGASTASAATPGTVLFNQATKLCPIGQRFNVIVVGDCSPESKPRIWELTPVPGVSGTVRIRLADSGPWPSCLVAAGLVAVRPCQEGQYQQWEVSPYQATGNPPDYDMVGIRLRSVSTGLCLDNDDTTIAGWHLYLHECNDGEYQQWNVYKSTYQALFGGATHRGMTWGTLEQRADNVVHVGYYEGSDPYYGDTPSNTALPVLCLKKDGRPAPAGVPASGYHSWAGGEVGASAPVLGNQLTSRAAADQVCASTFGGSWRMAEFHDGEGWSLWANGTLPAGGRFWTAINDQSANPWS